MSKRKKRHGKYLCGQCKGIFETHGAVRDHIRGKHEGKLVHIYEKTETIDLREDDDESFADRARAAEIAIAMGEHTDDEWLLP